MTNRFERRSFLKGVLSCMASLPALASVGCGSEGEDGVAPSRFRTAGSKEAAVLGSYFDDPEMDAAAFVGERYLALVAPNASDDDIAAIIAPVTDLLASSDTEASALAALRAKILADFQAEATALVDGWIFSVTELRLCVLLATLLA